MRSILIFLGALLVLCIASAAEPEPPLVENVKIGGEGDENGGLEVLEVRQIRMPSPNFNVKDHNDAKKRAQDSQKVKPTPVRKAKVAPPKKREPVRDDEI